MNALGTYCYYLYVLGTRGNKSAKSRTLLGGLSFINCEGKKEVHTGLPCQSSNSFPESCFYFEMGGDHGSWWFRISSNAEKEKACIESRLLTTKS
jgi:hypothetical protein